MLRCRTSFVRQEANLLFIQDKIQIILLERLCSQKNLFLFDGFPIPVCHVKRLKRSNPFRGEAQVGYCAAKDEKYYGFKGHLLISSQGVMKILSVTSANIDERNVMPEVVGDIKDDVLADKGLIRPELSQMLFDQGLNLHTPLRKNMNDARPKSFVSKIMNIHRKVETVIGQLVERFKIQAIKAKDMCHLTAEISRKILAYSICCYINYSINSENSLQWKGFLTFIHKKLYTACNKY